MIPASGGEAEGDAERTTAAKQPSGTWGSLVNVASNLYRNPSSGIYYGRCKIAGRPQLHCLDTADRKTADRKLSDWLDSARRLRPEVSRSTMEELLSRFQATRVHCDDSTKLSEKGFATSFRLFFDCNRRVTAVRGSELKAFINTLAKERNYSANTYNRVCLFLRQLFDAVHVADFVGGLRRQAVRVLLDAEQELRAHQHRA